MERVVEGAAYRVLLLVAVAFAFEPIRLLFPLSDRLLLSWVELVLLLTVGLWVVARILEGKPPSIPRTLAIPVALWLLLLLLSALFAEQRLHALKFAARVLQGVLLGWAAYDLTTTEARWRNVMRAVIVGGVVVGGLGVAEASGNSAIAWFLSAFKNGVARVGDIPRISSTLSYPTIAAMVLELVAPLILVAAMTERRRLPRILLALSVLFILTTLVLTWSRAALLSLGIVLLGMAALALWKRDLPQARPVIPAVLSTLAALGFVTLAVYVGNPAARLRLVTENEQGWYQAALEAGPVPEARPGQALRVSVTIRNTGVRTWEASGPQPFLLSYHLLEENGSFLDYDGVRTPLPRDMRPGESVLLQASLVAPERPGRYQIEWDMLQEGVTWFGAKGSPTTRRVVLVTGEPVKQSASRPAQQAERVVQIPPVGRMELWTAAGRMFVEHPLLGAGPDVFRLRYGAYLGLDVWDPHIHTNNLYIEWLVGTGLLGFVAFIWWNVRVLHIGLRSVLRGGALWIWRVALLASLLTWYLHGVLDYFFEFTATYVAYWLLVGLLIRATVLEQERDYL